MDGVGVHQSTWTKKPPIGAHCRLIFLARPWPYEEGEEEEEAEKAEKAEKEEEEEMRAFSQHPPAGPGYLTPDRRACWRSAGWRALDID